MDPAEPDHEPGNECGGCSLREVTSDGYFHFHAQNLEFLVTLQL